MNDGIKDVVMDELEQVVDGAMTELAKTTINEAIKKGNLKLEKKLLRKARNKGLIVGLIAGYGVCYLHALYTVNKERKENEMVKEVKEEDIQDVDFE